MEDTRLGALLLESGLITEEDLERCLSIQALTGSVRPIGQVLVEQGFVDQATVGRLLALQKERAVAAAAKVAASDTMSSSLLGAAGASRASEMVVSEGRRVRVRVGGDWRDLTNDAVAGPEVWDFAREVVGPEVLEEVAAGNSVLRPFESADGGRGTARVFRHFDGVGVRLQFEVAPDAGESIGVPASVSDLVAEGRGLVLVASERGELRSEAIVHLTERAAHDASKHVIVIGDDPLAFADAPALCTQHRLGDTPPERAAALRHALRHDPDAIVIADLGDAAAFEVALRAAEGGRLVIACLSASSVGAALHRILDFYPEHDLPRVRSALAAVLRAVVVRQRLPHSSGEDSVIANELLLVNDAVRNALRRGGLSDVTALLRLQSGECGHALDKNMLELLAKGDVRIEDVFARAEEKAWVLERTRDVQNVTE